MTSWASPRDAYPSSVHALMSLWGDFSTAPGSDSGLEKRFEVDFAQPITTETFTVAEVEEVFASAEQYLLGHKHEHHVTALTFSQVLVALSSHQMVASADSTVQLHKVVAPFIALCARKGVQVEWASFFRKNTHSPWEDSDTSDMMACEYAELKSSLPQGHSFLTGPIDGDHFFHYIYDSIARGAADARPEVDTQLNLFLHGLKEDQVTTPTVKGANHQLVVLPEGYYEMHRKFPEAGSATFETNNPDYVADTRKISALLAAYEPTRFTIVCLEDTNAEGCNVDKDLKFEHYTQKRRTANYFGAGYSYIHCVFERAE